MARFLSEEWLRSTRELAAGQPDRPGASARIQYVVTGGPDGEVRYGWVLEDGRLAEAAAGELADADVTFTEAYADAVLIQRGELDPGAAFMQGRVKVSGNMAKVMSLLPITGTPEYRDLMARVDAVTEY
ncbi:MAG TPA: SCP2 sterol-binding domain-containing protein [Acidimicrobiales bacterium]|nr:SCP2 sterol-binding domain-containing protein [Acidimicrobiales bacterium]